MTHSACTKLRHGAASLHKALSRAAAVLLVASPAALATIDLPPDAVAPEFPGGGSNPDAVCIASGSFSIVPAPIGAPGQSCAGGLKVGDIVTYQVFVNNNSRTVAGTDVNARLSGVTDIFEACTDAFCSPEFRFPDALEFVRCSATIDPAIVCEPSPDDPDNVVELDFTGVPSGGVLLPPGASQPVAVLEFIAGTPVGGGECGLFITDGRTGPVDLTTDDPRCDVPVSAGAQGSTSLFYPSCTDDSQCDDGISCTVDVCDVGGTGTCSSTPSDELCDDGLFCTGVETCDPVNDCQDGPDPDPNDGVGCTDDSCDEENDRIVNAPNDALCDDGMFCTGVETCDPVNDCQEGEDVNPDDGVGCTDDSCDEENDRVVNAPNDALCDDGLFCTGVETCDPVNDCQDGDDPNPDDGVGCTDDSCDEENDRIVNAPNDALCDDGQFCTGVETCDPVNDCQTVDGSVPDPDDGVGCTDDSCDEVNDRIVNAPNDSLCDDGQFCTGVETCDPVNDCQDGDDPNPDDGVGCTDDSCDEVNDRIVNAPNDALCDDGMFCTGVETCDPVNDCQDGEDVNPDDGVGCTDDACDEVNDRVVNVANDSLCDDGQFCTGVETCDPVNDCQDGEGVNPDDGVGCTDDACDEVNDRVVNVANDSLCDDGQFCTGVETCDPVNDCQDGEDVNPDDGVGCTDDACDEVNDRVVNVPNDALCDDGQFCTGVETCDPVNDCQDGPDPDPNDGVGCTDDSCDEVNDRIVNVPNDALCDDGQFCTGVETCDPVNDCQDGDDPNPDDGVSCTDDACDEVNDRIVNVPNDALCDDGMFCTGVETCDPVNDCQDGDDPDPNDGVGCTDDSCDEVNDRIVNAPNDSLCDDGMFCTGVETCDPVNDCQDGDDPNPDDGVSCTDDACDEVNDRIVNVPNDALCDDGQFCTGVETCDPVNDCQDGDDPDPNDGVGCTDDSCDEVNDRIVNVPNDALCDDGQFCTGVETCDPVNDCQDGDDPDPNDGVGCTDDSCDEVNDRIVNVPNDALCDDGQFCTGVETCDPVNDCQDGDDPDPNDGVGCTDDSCDEVNDRIVNAPNDALCDDGQFCTGVETCDPVNDCQDGDDPDPNDGVGCTDDSCDEVNDRIVNAPNDALCDDGMFCTGVETCDPVNDCQDGPDPDADDGVGCTDDSCDEQNDRIVNMPNDSLCDDGMFCTGVETCDPVNDCQDGDDVNPDDGVGCTDDSCDEENDRVVNMPNDSLCDDGMFCTGVETCDPVNDCQDGDDVNPDDGVGCTDDSCDEENDRVVNMPNDSLCDDGMFCTGVETCDPVNDCQDGDDVNPDDGVGCTDDSCDEENDRVVNMPNDSLCDDGMFCTGVETCDPANDCQNGDPVDPDDGVGCTDDSCDEENDRVVNMPNDSACDDGMFCTGVETCDPVNDCQNGDPVDPDDGVGCTQDKCDEVNDRVLNVPRDEACDDGMFCTGVETCDPVNDCQDGPDPDPNDGVGCTDDSCDEANDRIVNVPNDALCDDGMFCTGVETCDPVNDCQDGPDPDPNDGVGCTDDSCDEANDRIVNMPNDALCDDGMFCTGVETCDPVNDCQDGPDPDPNDGVGCTDDSCDEANDRIVNMPNDALCDDGMFCTGVETCDPVNDCQDGDDPDPNDGVGCTDDSCDEDNDRIVNVPNDSLCDDGMFCSGVETCDPVNDCQDGEPVDPDDGVGCTDDSCDEENDRVVNAPNDGLCDDKQFCNGVEVCDPEQDCQNGEPVDPDDGVGCTLDECDEENDRVVNTPDDRACDDGQFCTGIETCDPEQDCQDGEPVDPDDGVGCTLDECDEENDRVVNIPDDSVCDDSVYCNGVEICDPENDCQSGREPCDDGDVCTDDECDEVTRECTNVCDPSNDMMECSYTIGDYIWADSGGDCLQGGDDEGVDGVLVKLRDCNGGPAIDEFGNPVSPVYTYADGFYKFVVPACEPTARYRVKVADRNFEDGGVLGDYASCQLYADTGQPGSPNDSDCDPDTHLTACTTFVRGEPETSLDCGFSRVYNICRAPKFWGGHLFELDSVLTAAGVSSEEPLTVCGEDVWSLDNDVPESVTEALCVGNGDQYARGAQMLMTTSINCLLRTGNQDCAGTDRGDIIEACQFACAERNDFLLGECLDILGCWKDNGEWIDGRGCVYGTCAQGGNHCAGPSDCPGFGNACVPFEEDCHDMPLEPNALDVMGIEPPGPEDVGQCIDAISNDCTIFDCPRGPGE